MTEISMKAAGIDTGKTWLDVATYPVSDKQKVPNNADGCQTLADWLERQGIGRVGIEASGGYERDVIAYLHQRGFEVVLLQPRQVRALGLYKLRRAKNDQLDAALIAECAARSDARCHAPDSRLIAFGEWLLFIEQIEADIACLKTRRERFTDRRILEEIDRSIGELKSRCKAQLALLQAAVREHDDLARKLDLIESIDGIGIRTALTLVILMPELGRVDREEIAALTGVAPYDDQSGKREGERHIAGGRARVRRALFNAALPASQRWNETLVELYDRLTAKGKSHKAALIACVRKLIIFANTVVKRQTPWTKSAPQQNSCA